MEVKVGKLIKLQKVLCAIDEIESSAGLGS